MTNAFEILVSRVRVLLGTTDDSWGLGLDWLLWKFLLLGGCRRGGVFIWVTF